jgi:YebC/PmpR family DNA-binding regulatory protein
MAGHSHWAGIKHKKALIDNKRGKLWSKLAKAIMVAARMGGPDPDANIRLRFAIDSAKAVSLPKENIQRAIKAGSGDSKADNLEETIYEGYGAGGVAVMCEIVTDNRNRTAGEIRKIFELGDGNLGSTGCVAWMFERKGLILVAANKCDEDQLMEVALEHGADDVQRSGDNFEITCDPSNFQQLTVSIEAAGVTPEAKEISRIPTNTVDLDADTARKVLKMMEALDDHDDVQAVAANFNIPDEVMAGMDAG